MPKSKKAIYKNMLIKDLVFIQHKALVMDDIKHKNYTLRPIENKGYWYSFFY